MRNRLKQRCVVLALFALLAACQNVPPNAPPMPPPKPEMQPVLPNTFWVMGYWRWSGTQWTWIPGHLAPKP
ncbi:CDI system lipoprotein BcpO [Paraburkholderia ginsengisoli]|uniref:CDI system lipoprotein BcpO n=1 Tax=Paraburkholderia ginsengisoli TaxID=311231 RepID=A0A7T4N596_9BURK|nr:CDI system lipoprotein BcpO [Paraburkholderia ginsengisoli]QQC65501.1 CDI system lipoprotein BcpO [Paraburkholderia ginsengisoli]